MVVLQFCAAMGGGGVSALMRAQRAGSSYLVRKSARHLVGVGVLFSVGAVVFVLAKH